MCSGSRASASRRRRRARTVASFSSSWVACRSPGDPANRSSHSTCNGDTTTSGARVYEALAVHHQQPALELGAGQPSGGQRLKPFAQSRACGRQRVNRVGLAALAHALARIRHQPGREPHDGLAALDQAPLKRPGRRSTL